MQAYWTLVRRELGCFFVSWTGYIIIAGVVFLLGFSFSSLLNSLNNAPRHRADVSSTMPANLSFVMEPSQAQALKFSIQCASHRPPQARFPNTRSTFVAPILPEPMLRISPRPASRVSRRPKGIEPSR